jgi:tripartite-type tricarboxylate transporter receptor subunit TctC
MKHSRRAVLNLTAGAVAFSAFPRNGSAQSYPVRPVRVIVGFGAGAALDIVERLIGQWLTERLSQPFIVENRPGAGGNVGAEVVAHAPGDGYTLLAIAMNNMINSTLYENLGFDFTNDITPIASIMRQPQVMVVSPSFPAKTAIEFIEYAKANPGKLIFASQGNGSITHLDAELFKMMTGADMVHAPYRSSPAALVDLMGGQVQVMFDNMPSSIELIKAGKLRALAVTTGSRSPQLPDVPALGELVSGYEASGWLGLGAPRGTPVEVVNILNKTVNDALADSQIRGRLTDLGGNVLPLSPIEYGRQIGEEVRKWARVIKAANIRVE